MIRFQNSVNGQELYVTGDIIDDLDGAMIQAWAPDFAENFQWPADIKEQLDEMDHSKPLTVYINSPGGSVPAGVAISSMLSRWKAPVTCVVDGWACSIATQIFFSGSIRKMPTNAYLMIHKPSCYMEGNADDLRKQADTLDTIQKGLESSYLKAAKTLSADDIHKMVNEETWLTGEEACDEFNIEPIAPVKTAAHWGKSVMNMLNIPKDIAVEPSKRDSPDNNDREKPEKETVKKPSEETMMAIRQAVLNADKALVKAAMRPQKG